MSLTHEPSIKADGSIDFGDGEAVRTLTLALLQIDFGLAVELPKDRLCPMVANRLDYIHLIEDLLTSSGVDYERDLVKGLDIGTGASCIYPLLACAIHPNWSFLATEVNKQSTTVALQNVKANGLPIYILPVAHARDPLLGSLHQWGPVDFCMCNPPFYRSAEQIELARATKATPIPSPAIYAESEAIYETVNDGDNGDGGETSFVHRLIRESEVLPQEICRWYTTLLGLKSSVSELKAYLEREGSPAQKVKVMPSQVGRTKRWVLAWSFQRPSRVRNVRQVNKWIIELRDPGPRIEALLQKAFKELQIRSTGQECETTHRLWTRRARRSGQLEECRLRFSLSRIGRTLELVLHEGDSTEFNTLVNSLRHRLCRQELEEGR